MYEDLNKLEAKFIMHDFPMSLGIEPTNFCNYNCIMCTNNALTRPKGIMDIRLYKKIIDEASEKNPHIRIYLDFYGEPLLIKFKLFYMIDYALKKGLSNININTNGSLLDEEMSEMLLDSGVSYISIDCDGFSKGVYESIRQGGNRDAFYKNAEYILNRKKQRNQINPIIEIKIIEMDENKNEVDTVMKYFQQKGAWTAKRRMHSWGGSNKLAKLDDNAARIICGKSIGICAITWDGKVTNCPSDADASVIWGDLNTESIESIWKKRNNEMIKFHFSHEFDKLPPICQKCNDWQLVGEERFDENGLPVQKNYKESGKTFAR